MIQEGWLAPPVTLFDAQAREALAAYLADYAIDAHPERVKQYQSRLEYELSTLNNNIKRKIVKMHALAEFLADHGYYTTMLGTASGALTLRIFDLTPVDPIEYDLSFEIWYELPNRARLILEIPPSAIAAAELWLAQHGVANKNAWITPLDALENIPSSTLFMPENTDWLFSIPNQVTPFQSDLLLHRDDSEGVFLLEKHAGLNMLVDAIAPRSYQELADAIMLYRPHYLSHGHAQRYISRHRHSNQPLHPFLTPIASSANILLYPEQILAMLRQLPAKAHDAHKPLELLRLLIKSKTAGLAAELVEQRLLDEQIDPASAGYIKNLLRENAPATLSRAHALACAMLIMQTLAHR
ncbi:MAG TPA: hypothetical protein ENM98_00615 [Halothiobacillaceae bacterium]|nr:hypothetical protein [Halothiobacillaceae bacterium]